MCEWWRCCSAVFWNLRWRPRLSVAAPPQIQWWCHVLGGPSAVQLGWRGSFLLGSLFFAVSCLFFCLRQHVGLFFFKHCTVPRPSASMKPTEGHTRRTQLSPSPRSSRSLQNEPSAPLPTRMLLKGFRVFFNDAVIDGRSTSANPPAPPLSLPRPPFVSPSVFGSAPAVKH